MPFLQPKEEAHTQHTTQMSLTFVMPTTLILQVWRRIALRNSLICFRIGLRHSTFAVSHVMQLQVLLKSNTFFSGIGMKDA